MPAPLLSGVLLAAGRARRMGREKLLLEVGGRPVVRTAAASLVAMKPREILVVTRADHEADVARALAGLPIRTLVNPRADDGMGTSIAIAAAAVDPASDALLLLQGDQPLVTHEMLEALVAEWEQSRAVFVSSTYDGLATTPVLFFRALFAELAALEGDRGARAVLDRHYERGRTVSFPAWRGRDVDTEEDYRALLALWETERQRRLSQLTQRRQRE
ncbi:MAG: molybdenum cofactor cytidylyltransferase [Candidatus Binatota bacterium]|nr:molybdenum cofactor cytidylyltransferase [Candidatus Binatota bacterium]